MGEFKRNKNYNLIVTCSLICNHQVIIAFAWIFLFSWEIYLLLIINRQGDKWMRRSCSLHPKLVSIMLIIGMLLKQSQHGFPVWWLWRAEQSLYYWTLYKLELSKFWRQKWPFIFHSRRLFCTWLIDWLAWTKWGTYTNKFMMKPAEHKNVTGGFVMLKLKM